MVGKLSQRGGERAVAFAFTLKLPDCCPTFWLAGGRLDRQHDSTTAEIRSKVFADVNGSLGHDLIAMADLVDTSSENLGHAIGPSQVVGLLLDLHHPSVVPCKCQGNRCQSTDHTILGATQPFKGDSMPGRQITGVVLADDGLLAEATKMHQCRGYVFGNTEPGIAAGLETTK